MDAHQPSFPVIADPTFDLYKTYDVEASWMGMLRSLRQIGRIIQAARQGYWPKPWQGPVNRIPADFLMAPDGHLVDVYYGTDAGDHMPPDLAVDAFIRFVESTAQDFAQSGCPMATTSSELGKQHEALQTRANVSFELLRAYLQRQFARAQPLQDASDSADHFLVLAEGAAVMSHGFRDVAIVARTAQVMRAAAAEIFAEIRR